MYSLNELNRPVLITVDEVLFHAPSDHDVDARQILNNIIIAEERFIAQAICYDMYEDLCEQKNVIVTSANINDLKTKIGNAVDVKDLKVGMTVNAIELVKSPAYVDLWNRYLWKITAEAVDAMCIVPSWLRHTSQGQQMNNPEVLGGNGEKSQSGDVKDVKFKIDSAIQDRINPLVKAMEAWICKNKSKFPKYCKTCECDEDGVATQGKSSWVFDAYEDLDKKKGRCCE